MLKRTDTHWGRGGADTALVTRDDALFSRTTIFCGHTKTVWAPEHVISHWKPEIKKVVRPSYCKKVFENWIFVHVYVSKGAADFSLAEQINGMRFHVCTLGDCTYISRRKKQLCNHSKKWHDVDVFGDMVDTSSRWQFKCLSPEDVISTDEFKGVKIFTREKLIGLIPSEIDEKSSSPEDAQDPKTSHSDPSSSEKVSVHEEPSSCQNAQDPEISHVDQSISEKVSVHEEPSSCQDAQEPKTTSMDHDTKGLSSSQEGSVHEEPSFCQDLQDPEISRQSSSQEVSVHEVSCSPGPVFSGHLRDGRTREEERLGISWLDLTLAMPPYSAFVPPSKRNRVEERRETPRSPVALISGDHSSHERQFTATFDPDILVCKICTEPLNPPIFQCSSGHIACSECGVKMSDICPSCSKPVGNIRCLAIEKLIESLQMRCRHAEYGCSRMVSFTNKESHELSCTFAPFTCPVPSCGFSNLVANFPQHFQDVHQVRTLDFHYDGWFTVMLAPSDVNVLLKADDMLFLLHCEKSTLGNIVYVTLFGAQAQADQYSYHLEVKKGKKRLSMEGIPRSILGQESKQMNDFLLIPLGSYGVGDRKLQLELSFNRSGN